MSTPLEPEIEFTNKRSFAGPVGWGIIVLFALVAIYFILYNGTIFNRLGLFIVPIGNASGGLGAAVVLSILFYSGRKGIANVKNNLPWYDVVLILAAIVSFGYPFFFYMKYQFAISSGYLDTPHIVLCIIALITLLEAGRRVLGVILPLLAVLVVAYLFLTEYTPGLLRMHDIELSRIAWQLYGGEEGIFGVAAQVASTIIIMFIIFATFLQRTGAGEFFLNLSFALFGYVRGGPAKVAVVASSIFGTFSGSASGNVAGTGLITIPLMKRLGYHPAFAAGVEAAASTGGQLMPPVMGAVAFIIADWLDIPYLSVCAAALVPALLYYLAVFTTVDTQAVKLGLRGLPRAELPKLWEVLKGGWYWVLPILVILITLVVFKYKPTYCGFLGFLSIIPLTFIKKKDRFTLKTTAESLQGGMVMALTAVVACGIAGIVIGAVSLTGIGLKLSSLIVHFAGGNMLILLILAALCAFLLGMGLPTIPVYIIVVVLVAPALIQMGIPALSAHLFVFYYGCLSFVTPPVALAAYTASAIANSKPIATALWSSRLAVVAFLIPFAIIYNPALLLNGSITDIVRAVILASIGTMAIAFGMGGHAFTKANWIQRIAFIVGGFMMYLSTWWIYICGFSICVVTMIWHLKQWRISRTVGK